MFFPTQLLTAGVLFTFVSYCAQLATALLSLLLGLAILAATKSEPSAQPADSGLLAAPPSSSSR
jgi:hypothetical protein